MPYALSMGVEYGSFWHLTPHDLAIIAEGHNIALKRQLDYDNHMAYIQGAYFVEALLATVGNMFSGKSSKKHDYPDKPYTLQTDEQQETEAERQRKLFASQLTTAMHNFNSSKSKEEGQSK